MVIHIKLQIFSITKYKYTNFRKLVKKKGRLQKIYFKVCGAKTKININLAENFLDKLHKIENVQKKLLYTDTNFVK